MAVAQSQRTHCPQGHAYDEANTTVSGGRRYCRACCNSRAAARRPPRPTLEEKFWSRFERQESGCWIWTAGTQSAGYGVFSLGKRNVVVLAHRFAYELLVEPIPDGLVIDHLCHTKLCVNPSHMDVVTIAENVRRGRA